MDEKAVHAQSPPATPATPATPVSFSFSRPRPRPPGSPARSAQIRVRNRRREYLDRNPGYLSSAEHEFADPDLYDTLVRRFQSPAEREAEGRARGWGKTLESSLLRGEARLERVAASHTGDAPPPSAAAASSSARGPGGARRDGTTATSTTTNFAIDADLAEGGPATREEGRAAWDEFLRERFVRGGDEDFDYGAVDGDEGLDAMEDRDREEAYFDDAEPEWADDSDEEGGDDDDDDDDDEHVRVGEGRPRRERILLGQTGIQDY